MPVDLLATPPIGQPKDLMAGEDSGGEWTTDQGTSQSTSLVQGHEEGTWDKIKDYFGSDKAEESAKASNALVYSEMLGIRPSTAYQFHDEISKQVKDRIATEDIALPKGKGEAAKAGLKSSIFGMMANQKVPDAFESPDQMERWINGFVQMGADIPFFLAGYASGGANPLTGTAGGFGLTDGIRKVLTDRYAKGEVQSFGELMNRTKSAVLATVKGEVTGAATGAAGKIPGTNSLTKAALEYATMTTVGNLVEGRIPTAQNFIDNVAIFAAMHIGVSAFEEGKASLPAIRQKFYDLYAKDGTHPLDIAAEGLRRADASMSPEETLRDIEENKPGGAPAEEEKPVVAQTATGLRPAVMTDETTIGQEGQTHADVIGTTGEDGQHVFATPDGEVLDRKRAEQWVKENEPEVHQVWEEDAGKGAEFHSEDYNEAKRRSTGIKNAAVDAQRAEMGLDPIESPTRKMGEDNWEKAKEDVDSGRADPLLLARSIIDTPRNLSPEETNVMNYGRAKLSAEHKSTMDAIEEARDYGDAAAEAAARDKLGRVEADINTMDEATKKSGTEWGLSGRMRQRMIAEDYSLDRLIQRARVESPTGEVSPEMRTRLDALSKQLEEANKKITEHEDQASRREAQRVVTRIKDESARQGRKAERKATKEALGTEYKALMKSLDKELSGLHANPMFNPEAIALFGKLARNRIEAGIVNIADIVDDIHGYLKGIGHEFDKRDIRDAISGYGKIMEMSKDEIDFSLREARRHGRLISALEDAKAKTVPLRSGLQRDKVTDEVRELQRQVRQAMREAGIDSGKAKTPEEQWKTSLDAVKTGLKNRIRDIAKQIETGEKTPKKVGIQLDDQAEVLKSLRDRMKQTLEAIEGKPEMPPEQRIKLATAVVEKSIAEYERRIKEKDLTPEKKGSKTPETPELKALRDARDKLKETYKAMQDAAKPKRSPEEVSLEAFKTRTRNRIKDMEQRLSTGDFSKEPRKTLALDPEAQELKAQAEKVKGNVDDAIKKQEFEAKGKPAKAMYYFSKWRRAMLLSSVTTLGKLTSAAMQRFGITPIEELIGGVLSKFPGVSAIAAKAPREGAGLTISAEAKAFSQFVEKATYQDIRQTLKTGKGSLDYLYGKKGTLPPEALDFFGHIHGALKVLPKRAEFFRSLEMRSQWALDNHLDIQDPRVQATLCADAYIDANRAIFMNDNALTTLYRMALGYLENKGTGGKIAATTLQTFLPIVKVPTNFAKEAANYAGGAAKGTIQVMQVLLEKDGLKNLTAYQADNIMRSLKKGSIGLALLAIGYYASDSVGGYYQPGDKKRAGALKSGEIRIGGVTFPSFLLHSPPIEVMRMGATIRDVNNSYDVKGRMGGMFAGAFSAGMGLAKTIPFFEEPARMAEATRTADTASMFVADLVKSLAVPPDVQKIAAATDPAPEGSTRKPKTVGQVFEMAIPGMRENVPFKGRQKRYSIRSGY